MQIIVVGYGSIGRRHALNLLRLGHIPVLVRHASGSPNLEGFQEFHDLIEAIQQIKPHGAVICSPTSCHLDDARICLVRGVPILLEKPPTRDFVEMTRLIELCGKNPAVHCDVAFNMRHFPPLKHLRETLPRCGRIYSARISAGYYLPDWRPAVDYRKTSSASAELGGGVHVELVHELDYILWFFGEPVAICACVTRVSALEITSADLCTALLRYADGSIVELHLDYLSRRNLRSCQIIGENGTVEWDILDGGVEWYGAGNERETLVRPENSYDLNETYLSEMRLFLGALVGESGATTTLGESVLVMRVLQSIEISSVESRWVQLSEVH